MIIAILIVFGLCLGSFVNALVYRLHEQSKPGNKRKTLQQAQALSIVNGRSLCVHCGHVLAWYDLLPIVSWILLAGKCRYCHKPISWQYPLVELSTATLFVISYLAWPLPKGSSWTGEEILLFGFWLLFLTSFMALAVYDFRWYLLPNRIIYPLLGLAVLQVIIHAAMSADGGIILRAILAAMVGGGLFYVLFQISNGKWIGGGDVKLGFLLGLLVGNPMNSLLVIFLASLIGSLVSVPLMASGKMNRSSHLPFGPLLILAAVVVQLYGVHITGLYHGLLLPAG